MSPRQGTSDAQLGNSLLPTTIFKHHIHKYGANFFIYLSI